MTSFEARESAPQDLDCGFDALRGDCARMAPRWPASPADVAPQAHAADLHRIVVPTRSAHMVEGMSEYGG